MYKLKNPTEKSGLDQAIDEILAELAGYTTDQKEYATALTQLERLYKLKTLNGPKAVSPDTRAIVMGNLLGILVIVGYERANIVTSKALNFILKATH